MNIGEEKKLVTVEVTPKQMDKINEIDFAAQTEFSTLVDLVTYDECIEVEYTILEDTLDLLKEANVEADIVQFYTL